MRYISFRWFSVIAVVVILLACASPKPIFNPTDLPQQGMQWVMVNNIPVVYTDQGHGETIVILSTYPLGTGPWNDFARLLSSSFRVIVVEPLWLTEPIAMKSDFSSEHLLQIYRTFIRKIGLRKIHVLGAGEGGGLAVAFGHHFPEHIKTAISINGFEGVTWSAETKEMLGSLYSTSEEGVYNLLNNASLRYQRDTSFREELKHLIKIPRQNEQIVAVASRMNALTQDIKAFYIPAMIEYINFPVLIIRSDSDAILPEKFVKRSHNTINGVQYQVISKAGHFAFMDQPEKTGELISNFILLHPGITPSLH